MQLTCDQVVSTYVGWPNGKKPASTLHMNLSTTKVNASRRKSTQVGGQTKRKSKTSVALRRLASPFGQGLRMAQEKVRFTDSKLYAY